MSPSSSPVAAAIAATVCVCLCMSAPSTIIRACPPVRPDRQLDRSADMACLRALPRSHQVTPSQLRPATSDIAKGSQAQTADSLNRASARRLPATISCTSDVADKTNQNSKPRRSTRAPRCDAPIHAQEARTASGLRARQGAPLRSPASVRAGRAGRPDRSRDVPRPARRREPHNSTSSGAGRAVPWPRHRPPAYA